MKARSDGLATVSRVGMAMLLLAGASAPLSGQATGPDDEASVRASVADYVDGIYEVAPDRIARSVSRDLVKRGYWRPDAEAEFREMPMNYEQLHQLAATWNADGHLDPSSAVREIVVLDVLDKTASAKLVADWGVDYMHLAKEDGRWLIKNILWQSPPRE